MMINSPPPTVSPAKSAEPDAIARYLNEKLSDLGISVNVFIQIIQKKDEVQTVQFASNDDDGLQASDFTIISSPRRLWVTCDVRNSPDPSLLAEPIAQHLRDLRLEGFRDAVVRTQSHGESNPDWFWRIDLTPLEEMVKDWARWGDVQAIALILNQSLTLQGMEVRVAIKNLTLHIFCSLKAPQVGVPDRQLALTAIAPLLESLAPQGIHAASIYAVEANSGSTDQESPAWVEWLNLPASIHPTLAPTALTLAQQGDRDALIFLLQRLVNPDLDRRLATGGIRIILKRKENLLHIMSEALICPLQKQVAPQIAKFLSKIEISNVAGVRIYGRRAGQSSPLWNYGIDFVNRNISTSDSEIDVQNTGSVGVAQKPQERNVAIVQHHPNNFQSAVKKRINDAAIILQQWLCFSQLFIRNTAIRDSGSTIPHTEGMEISANSQAVKVALVWATLGLLLTIQADWLIGYILRSSPQLAKVSQLSATAQQVQTQAVATAKKSDAEAIDLNPLPQLDLQKSKIDNSSVFNGKGFTESNKNSFTSDRQPDPKQSLNATQQTKTSTPGVTSSGIMSASSLVPQDIAKNNPTKLAQIPETDNPSFNNSLLDQKLALYQQICAESGTPDILIVGSSRALRGVDPAALKAALAAKGYGDLSVFNFGVNGATNQVVDFIIRRLLTQDQLPKLIIWADGARSFNSGRVDLTYNAIADSEGFQQLLAGNWSPANTNYNSGIGDKSATNSGFGLSSQSVNNWLNEILGKISTTYPLRDRLKIILSQQYASIIPKTQQPPLAESNISSPETSLNANNFDIDGFLPLSIRFQPTTYYQRYAKVSGDYDNDYDSFELNGQQDIALAALTQFLQERQIPLVFVNMPLTKQYLDPVRQKYEVQFINYIQQQQQQNKLISQDLSLLWSDQNQLFSDPSHLNRYGAFEVSKELAQNSMIPWPKK